MFNEGAGRRTFSTHITEAHRMTLFADDLAARAMTAGVDGGLDIGLPGNGRIWLVESGWSNLVGRIWLVESGWSNLVESKMVGEVISLL